jgi:hypothetical protein
MDTRTKIVTAAAAPAGCTVVTGYFDVVVAEDARELAEVKTRAGARRLVAVVLPLAGELLGQRARAEMAAGLRVVDYVVIAGEGEAIAIVHELRPAEVVQLEERQAERGRRLKEHVRKRCGDGARG